MQQHKQRGSCSYHVAIASILDLPVSEVPCFAENSNEHWFARSSEWARKRGLEIVAIETTKTRLPELLRSSTRPYIGLGLSPRGNGNHFIVCQSGKRVHDPHPSGDFLEGLETDYIFVVPQDRVKYGANGDVEEVML